MSSSKMSVQVVSTEVKISSVGFSGIQKNPNQIIVKEE